MGAMAKEGMFSRVQARMRGKEGGSGFVTAARNEQRGTHKTSFPSDWLQCKPLFCTQSGDPGTICKVELSGGEEDEQEGSWSLVISDRRCFL